MNCPRCNAPLSEVKVNEVVLDHCVKCGGLWLDFAQLERVLGRESRSLRRLLPKGGPPAQDEAAALRCPRCEATLIRMRATPEPLLYYGCLTCYGRWLDGSQLRRIVGRPLAAKFEMLFQKLLG